MKQQSLNGSYLRLRKSFGKKETFIEIPKLIELQKTSYEQFLQRYITEDRKNPVGLQGIFKLVFPIFDYKKTVSLEFVKYRLEYPKYDVKECRQRGMTYASPLKVTLRLIVFEEVEEGKEKTIRDIKEQDVYLSEIPIMTEQASFVINGTERVVVSQLHRSPGIFFDHDGGKGSTSGKFIYSARVIPYRGSWLDFEFDQKDIINVRIDRKRKFHATIFLKALGFSVDKILELFHDFDAVYTKDGKLFHKIDIERMLGQRVLSDIKDKKGNVLIRTGRRITRAGVKKVKNAGVKEVELQPEDLKNTVTAIPIIDPKTGEVLLESNENITMALINLFAEKGIKDFSLIFFDGLVVGPYISNTLLVDKVDSREDALLDIYKRMKPGEPPTLEAAEFYLENLFFIPETYDLGRVGRTKINHRFGFTDIPKTTGTLTKKDITKVVSYLLDLKNGKGKVDDIDHLGNRRIRSVGELLENQYRVGLVRMERVVRERMNLQDIETMMPHDLINAKSVSSVVKEFFGSSQLSQFMDQTNPLAEITHKRRLSAFGPGGLTRDRAGFEVRDVHPTHYGRICPIETPEGPNIGLIASLATFARVNEYGFIETPYRSLKNGQITDDVKYYSALDEEKNTVIQTTSQFNKLDKNSLITARSNGEYKTIRKDQATLMDVSPGQLVSIAASLIPFLEHDDANRALMGSNMQRQAVPLMISEAPLVGTGMEYLVARDSGNSVVCKNDGVIEDIDASRVVVRRLDKKGKLGSSVDIYDLIKYQRTNQNTCFNQKPIVQINDRIKRGDVIADGLSTDKGELALGKNILVAFMPWSGYNFEDSILISERLIKDDVYTSIHVEEFECLARDTKLGKEEITADIPNVGEEALLNLDSSGIIRIGAEVRSGDILVAKVTPKADSQLSPEKKLVLAIFGEKAGEVKDTSLRVPSGVTGIVIDTQVYSREEANRSERLQKIIAAREEKFLRDFSVEKEALKNNVIDDVRELLIDQKTADVLLSDDGSEKLLSKEQKISESDLIKIPFELLSYIPLSNEKISVKVTEIVDVARSKLDALEVIYKERVERLSKGDELLPGVIKMIKVYVAVKRKVQVGDKFAGRHGNKGVISKTLPEGDMPYLADGTPVDMVLNPLGVPSRMNVGQILETHLGWAAYGLGKQLQKHLENFKESEARKAVKSAYLNDSHISKIVDSANEESIQQLIKEAEGGIRVATPVFDGAKEEEVKQFLNHAQLSEEGQTVLFDGRTGEPFQMPVTVGIMYMLKLHHLIEEKIHARSIGPYSLVSQQPLGGKSQFGGQRLGEMEVWAIEAYGAAYCLQEFLTVKSDDVAGRVRMYENIVKGENNLEPGIPESFNVLVNEMKSLCLNVEMFESEILTEKPKVILDEEVKKSVVKIIPKQEETKEAKGDVVTTSPKQEETKEAKGDVVTTSPKQEETKEAKGDVVTTSPKQEESTESKKDIVNIILKQEESKEVKEGVVNTIFIQKEIVKARRDAVKKSLKQEETKETKEDASNADSTNLNKEETKETKEDVSNADSTNLNKEETKETKEDASNADSTNLNKEETKETKEDASNADSTNLNKEEDKE